MQRLEELQRLQSELQMQVQLKQAQAESQNQLSGQLATQPQVFQIQTPPQAQSLTPQLAVQASTAAGLAGMMPTSLQSQLTKTPLGISLSSPASLANGSLSLQADGGDEVVKALAQKIDELQRQLRESQMQLQLTVIQQQQQQLIFQQHQQQQLHGQPMVQVQLPAAAVPTSTQPLLGQVRK